MGILVVQFVLIYSFCNAMFIFCSSSSMQLDHPLTTRLEGNESDRLALLAIKAQIQHDPNQVTSSWNESLHFCLWHGVTCSRKHDQRVAKLELMSLTLVGSISPHIGNLSFLRVLNLKNNSFNHQIPPQIGQLRRLQVLLLHNNSLSGTIPSNISNCIQLVTLFLSRNNLVGRIPPKLSSLSKLKSFVLQNNNLTGEIPPSLGNLSSLEAIGLGYNNLEGSIPSVLCRWKKLTIFSLAINRLSGIIPPCIYNISGIVQFEVLSNQIQGTLPSNLGTTAFPNLQIFSVDENQFTGAIPWSISNATNLVWFQCSSNKLTGQVPNLQNLHNLVVFNVQDNNLGTGKHGDLSFVSELINATSLTWLGFSHNNFGGTLPTSISNLSTNLQMIFLQGNRLEGSIPTGLGNLVNLLGLLMGENNFTGSIPRDIGKVSRLQEIYLGNNKLYGSIPSSLGNLTELTILHLQGNNLNGSIPSSLGECHQLLELDLSHNNLDGKVPQQLLIGLHSLSISLNLSKNHFTGSLPFDIGKLKNLAALDVSYNMLSGQLPSSLGSCESLEVLYIQCNFLEGLIPSSLSFNQFWGAVPTEGIFRNASATSVLGNTKLCGGIASLGLPVCNFKESKGGELSHRMKLVIFLTSGFTLLGLGVVLALIFLRKRRKETEVSTFENSGLPVSYATLLKATGGFSSVNLIGVGAFGSVYKGILSDDKVVVAVKVLNMLHRGASKSFMAECEVLRNIRHRNLVKILTACSSIDFSGNSFMALVYEFMENGSLEDWLHPSTGNEELLEAPKSLSLVQRLDIAINIACALDYLHNHCETPIVHCDLKPSNVLLDKDLTGHVSDFGLARFLQESTNVSRNQSRSIGIRGSVGYVAPEYGMGSEVSTYGDVYSFGILLLEMFTGKRPTDRMFGDGLNLHYYVKTALPKRVTDIADSLILQGGNINVEESHNMSSLILIFGIGLACSVESPTTRKAISDVAYELHSIRENLLN
ncbi:PREDICTED: probable LRR receptor-like serine/threonine-protein kinase At3g47570-like [Fragaria vesca subsp. vesca]